MEGTKEKESDFKMIATTLYGLEEVLAAELLKLGAKNIEPLNRSVSFYGDWGFLYKANLCLRTALRVLVPIKKFRAETEGELYNSIKNMRWENYIDVMDSIAVDTVLNTELFNHSQYVSQKTKDAICDRFRELTGKRPSVNLNNPTLQIQVHIYKNNCTVSFDSSGESLHKRGYREHANIAPINEVLAAGMIQLAGVNRLSHFIDPMCGSGTIAIEAAMHLANIPPGIFKRSFAFMNWNNYNDELYKTILNSALNKISDDPLLIHAFDISENNIKKAKKNAANADTEDMIRFSVSDFIQLEKPFESGTLIMNPPYGERMDKDEISDLYKSIGDRLKKHWTGWDAWIITSGNEAIHSIGLRPSRKITLYNGSIECKFLKFSLYSGTKKIHKINHQKKEN